jgi:hypothetical protein
MEEGGSQGGPGRVHAGEGQGGGREPGWAREGVCDRGLGRREGDRSGREGVHRGGPGRREGARVGQGGNTQGRAREGTCKGGPGRREGAREG